jgi:hypothetical protein
MLCPSGGLAQDVYRWKDDKGTVHFTDDPSLIPERHWDQIQREKMPEEPPSAHVPGQPPAAQRGAPPQRKPEAEAKTDVLGRGEEWWSAQAKRWQEKLRSAQEGWEVANAAVMAKGKELRDSVFKADSYKRRLQLELRTLRDKAEEWEKQVQEAKTMLEKTLPRQAEEYLADPSWLNIGGKQ